MQKQYSQERNIQKKHTNQYVSVEPTTDNLSRAIFTVNRHAKTAPNPKFLYLIKKKALEKLLHEGRAQKCGLHFSRNPKNSKQQSDLLVSVGEYYFHMPPSKEDFNNLPHLGKLEHSVRNPKTKMSLTQAKTLLQSYTGIQPKKIEADTRYKKPHQKYQKPVFKKLGETF